MKRKSKKGGFYLNLKQSSKINDKPTPVKKFSKKKK